MGMDNQAYIIGIEIMDASEKMILQALLNISIENMPLEKI